MRDLVSVLKQLGSRLTPSTLTGGHVLIVRVFVCLFVGLFVALLVCWYIYLFVGLFVCLLNNEESEFSTYFLCSDMKGGSTNISFVLFVCLFVCFFVFNIFDLCSDMKEGSTKISSSTTSRIFWRKTRPRKVERLVF